MSAQIPTIDIPSRSKTSVEKYRLRPDTTALINESFEAANEGRDKKNKLTYDDFFNWAFTKINKELCPQKYTTATK